MLPVCRLRLLLDERQPAIAFSLAVAAVAAAVAAVAAVAGRQLCGQLAWLHLKPVRQTCWLPLKQQSAWGAVGALVGGEVLAPLC